MILFLSFPFKNLYKYDKTKRKNIFNRPILIYNSFYKFKIENLQIFHNMNVYRFVFSQQYQNWYIQLKISN